MPSEVQLRAKLRRIQGEILALTERAPRAPTGWTPPKQPGLVKPCALCGRDQPSGQSPEAIRAYAAREPTSVLYTRADGTVRAHAVGCDLLPHGKVKPDRPTDAPDRVRGANAALGAHRADLGIPARNCVPTPRPPLGYVLAPRGGW